MTRSVLRLSPARWKQTDAAQEAAFVAGLERRAAELESGAVDGVSWEDLREKLMRHRRGS